MTAQGFNVVEVCSIENERGAIERQLSKYAGDDDVVIILASDKFWNKHSDVFISDGHPCQLFSTMKIYYQVLLPGYKAAYELFDEELSREIFTEVLNVRFKLKAPSALYPYFDPNQYFTLPEMNIIENDSVFVDCGAFVGDSVEKFINASQSIFGKIYAFEPSKAQQKAFLARRARLLAEWALTDSQIQLIRAGVGSKRARAEMTAGIMSDNIIGQTFDKATFGSNSDNAIDIVPLDEVLTDENVRLIKSDVEGFEMEMLRGAEQIIRTKKPLLALSIYHKLSDYYEMPLFIKSLVPEYKLRLRHHSKEFTETVLYCTI
ncbi:MAG: FkbM family methyltransferase [Selenomonadaceae bacterium]|nr:FkbM family methyltransferase [Selenomonadaceae bacterium]